ncbi:MAG: type 1 glutamine amidotransferase domain-containing protein [Pseudomonadota bacterium]
MTAKRALIIATNHTDFEKPKADPTGLWMSELVHAYDVFEENGIDIDIVSPAGGKVAVDRRSLGRFVFDKASRRRYDDPTFMALLENTKSISDVDWSCYDIVFFAGGHGAMWDFAENNELHALTAEAFENGKIISAVCHGNAVLPEVKLSNGKHLIEGKKGTGFSYFDETIAGVKKLVPYNMEKRLKDAGMKYSKAFLPLGGHTVVDGNLITGQNPNSTTKTALAVVRALESHT